MNTRLSLNSLISSIFSEIVSTFSLSSQASSWRFHLSAAAYMVDYFRMVGLVVINTIDQQEMDDLVKADLEEDLQHLTGHQDLIQD